MRSERFEIWGDSVTFEDQFIRLETKKGLKKNKKILASRECDIFRTQTGVDLGWPSLARSACPFPGNTVAKESHSNGLQEVLPVIP